MAKKVGQSIVRALYLPGPTRREQRMDDLSGPGKNGKTDAMLKGDQPAYINQRKRWNLKMM